MACLPSVRITRSKATNKAKNSNSDKDQPALIISYTLFLYILIIECLITVECHTMLLNGVMLKSLNA